MGRVLTLGTRPDAGQVPTFTRPEVGRGQGTHSQSVGRVLTPGTSPEARRGPAPNGGADWGASGYPAQKLLENCPPLYLPFPSTHVMALLDTG